MMFDDNQIWNWSDNNEKNENEINILIIYNEMI